MSEYQIVLSESLPKYSDKCIFPVSLLSDALALNSQLPHPLIFTLNDSLLVGVKEFTAPPLTIHVPEEVYNKLEGLTATCSTSSNIEKGTFLTLKPLQFYPHVTNWKYYLESFLSTSYTTLSKGQTLNYEDPVARETVSLLVEDSNASSVIVVDTDIALDVIPLDDIMGAQQQRHNSAMSHIENVPLLEENTELELEPFHDSQVPRILKVDLLNTERFITISLATDGEICNVDMIVGLDKLLTLENFYTCTMLQDEEAPDIKTIVLDTRVDQIANHIERFKTDSACWLYIVPFAWSEKANVKFTLTTAATEEPKATEDVVNGQQCSNCDRFIDPANFTVHEAFCQRNNIKCSCGEVFRIKVPASHWHCESCTVHGNSATFKYKHSKIMHEAPYRCTQCSSTTEYSSFIDLVQNHKSTECPAKLTECLFCHLIVPQEESTYEDKFANLTHHESQCGNRTAECYQCGKVLRNKDMTKHLQIHAIVKSDQDAELANLCLNHVCSNILLENDKRDNVLGLCGTCYGPLYSTLLDTDNSKLQNRIERKYVIQLTKGCENGWCRNTECSISRGKMGIQEALTRVKEVLLPAISHPHLPINGDNKKENRNTFWFCVNQSNQEKKNYIDALLSEGAFPKSQIYKAVNKEGVQGAKSWLVENARGSA